ncbi:Fe3+/spermidine/putrescine ABC transporter ATP-binding protein, partial [Prosthecomicrobium hirschii]|uniref:ABC transporter ATP-binding protein n=1 Tax=Prosthecodimorpha hirschii TaxID=665126 RepID=UPI00112922C6
MSTLTFEALGKSYGDTEVVRDISLTIREGEFVSLLGPSGCGKTTILRMVAGLVEPSRGRILIGSDDVTRLPPNRRGLGLVFQSYALFPHLSVYENVAFGLRRRKVAGAELDRRVREAL